MNVTNNEIEGERGWFVLVYNLPSEPSRYRASVWRKRKAAGAVYLQNGVAALPDDPGGERTMRGVAREIREVGDTTHLFRGASVGDRGSWRKSSTRRATPSTRRFWDVDAISTPSCTRSVVPTISPSPS